MSSEILIFLAFILIGGIIGFFFDIFRILRKVFNTSDFVTSIEDIVFWLLTGILLLSGIFILNEGKIRAYLLMGMLVGLFSYIAFLSRIIVKIGVQCLKRLKNCFLYIINNIK